MTDKAENFTNINSGTQHRLQNDIFAVQQFVVFVYPLYCIRRCICIYIATLVSRISICKQTPGYGTLELFFLRRQPQRGILLKPYGKIIHFYRGFIFPNADVRFKLLPATIAKQIYFIPIYKKSV